MNDASRPTQAWACSYCGCWYPASEEMVFTTWALENPDQAIVRQARAAIAQAKEDK